MDDFTPPMSPVAEVAHIDSACVSLAPQTMASTPDLPDEIESEECTDEGFDKNFVYHEIRAKLAHRGIPPEQVAFIQEHNTRTKRAALFAAMRQGDVRVLIASKQTTGMNVQDRLIALHHLDAPWRPGDVEQREGRIRRQGNLWPEVYVFTYVTEGSFDGFIWQTLETKTRFIDQLRRGDVTIRTMDDISEVVLSAAEIKAVASGNPKVILKVQLEAELMKLESLNTSHRDTQARMRRRIREIGWEREALQQRREQLIQAQHITTPYIGSDFQARILEGVINRDERSYTKRDSAGKKLRTIADLVQELSQQTRQVVSQKIGSYSGLFLQATGRPWNTLPDLTLIYEIEDGTTVTIGQIKAESDGGVFASVDARIRGITDEIAKTTAALTHLDQEEAKTQAVLNQPWDQAERYQRIRGDLELLNTELSSSNSTDPIAKAEMEVRAERQRIAHAAHGASLDTGSTGTIEIAAPDDAIVVDRQSAQILPIGEDYDSLQLPPIIIPMPSDMAAMERAMAQLAASGGAIGTETIQVLSNSEQATAGEPEEQVAVEELLIGQLERATIIPQTGSRAVVLFGDMVHIATTRKKKAIRRGVLATPQTPAQETENLFIGDLFSFLKGNQLDEDIQQWIEPGTVNTIQATLF